MRWVYHREKEQLGLILFVSKLWGEKRGKKKEKRSPQDSITASVLSAAFQNPLEKVTWNEQEAIASTSRNF